MRRTDREITDFDKMLEIMRDCDCCRLGLLDGNEVYIVPMNFGVRAENGHAALYFHSACEGRKLDCLRNRPHIGFEMDTKHMLVEHETPCGYSFRYQSIIGSGTVSLIEGAAEKTAGLRCIMAHYSGREDWDFPQEALAHVSVLRLDITEWSCKERK